jgi:hypothetical protein
MPRITSFSALGCAALIAACQASDTPAGPTAADAPAPAAAVIHTRQRVEIIVDDVFLNECSGEQMQFHFNQLMVAHDLEIVGRQFHAQLVQMDRGSNGVGLTTGARYRQVGAQKSSFFISAKIDEVQTFVATTALIGTGGAPSARGTITYHLTVGPTGRVVVEFNKARFTCR